MARTTAPAADEPETVTVPVDDSAVVAFTLPPELASRFVTEAVTPDPDKAAIVRANAGAIATAVEQLNQLPDGRYKSLALTALEEAQMWASKAVFA